MLSHQLYIMPTYRHSLTINLENAFIILKLQTRCFGKEEGAYIRNTIKRLAMCTQLSKNLVSSSMCTTIVSYFVANKEQTHLKSHGLQ